LEIAANSKSGRHISIFKFQGDENKSALSSKISPTLMKVDFWIPFPAYFFHQFQKKPLVQVINVTKKYLQAISKTFSLTS
jgi:hypothetical protein